MMCSLGLWFCNGQRLGVVVDDGGVQVNGMKVEVYNLHFAP